MTSIYESLEESDHLYPSSEYLLEIDGVSDSWRDAALCARLIDSKVIPDSTFLVDDEYNDEYLASVCAQCPVMDLCLRDACLDDTAQGYRAGYRFDRGAVLREDMRELKSKYGYEVRIRNRKHVAEVQEVRDV